MDLTWCGFSVTDLLRFPGLVFCVLCIHQLWIFSGQKNQRVALWTGSVKEAEKRIYGKSSKNKEKKNKKKIWSQFLGFSFRENILLGILTEKQINLQV